MNPLASPSQLKETPGPDPIPVSDEELARLMPEMAGPEPVAVDLLAPENLDAYILAKEADEAAGGPGFLSRMGDAAVDLVSQVGMAGKLTGQNVLSGAGAVISADGEELKKALRRQVALTTQAAAAIGGSYAMTGETVKGAFKEVGTKLSVGYQDTPENRRKIYAVRQANDRSMRDVQGVVDDALLIADNLVGGLDLNTAYAPAERETMLRAAGGAAEVLDVAFTAGAAAGAKLGAKVASRTAIAAERAATSVGAEKVAELIKSTRAYAGSIPETLYRVAAETAGNKMPNFGSLMDSAKRLAVLQEERALIEAAEDSLTKTKALADNASKVAELRTQIERLQSEFVRRADEAALTYAGRPVTQQLAGGAVEMAGDVLSGTAERVQRGVDWLRNKRAGALGTSGEAVQAGDEVFERVAGVSPSMVERTAGWFNELGENVSAAGRLMRTMESSTPYFQRLAKETDGWTRFAAQNANRVEFVARLGRGAAEGIDGAVKGATVGGVFGLLQGDSAEGAGEGLVGGFFGGGLRTIRMERDPAMVRARQLGDIADARSRRTGLQQQLFDAAPRNLQLAASTFEATNPNLVVNFVRQKGSGGSYRVNPDGTGEATIDLDSKIPLVPLLAHEVSHHIARNPDIASDLKRRFLGDDKTGTPGFLTEMRDGALQPKPEFQKFRDEYLSALRRAGKDTAAYEANPELILHEVIAEAGVSSLLATNASGEFAGIAALRRNARPVAQVMEQFARSEMVMNSGVLQRALMATGAVFTDGGQHAKGTGLFSADMSPELRSAVNQIIGEYDRMALSERGGQVESFSETPTIYSEQEIASNPELLDLVSSGFDVDVDEKTGKRKFLSAREAKKREQEFIDDLIQALDASPDLSPGRVRAVTTKDGRTIYSGKYIPADVLETLQSRNKYNPRQLETLAMVTDLLGKRPGNEVHFVYQPAMTRGSRLYKQRAVTNRVETPISILISKTGGVLINTLSQEKVLRNLEFFSRKGMLGAWGGDVRAARADLLKYIDNTVAGREGAEGLGLEKRDALNALFGQLTNVQKERNPVLQGMSDAQGRKIGVVQSRRIDRTNQMKVLDSSFRADYGRVSENLRPDVLPIPERFTGTGEEGDRQSKKVDAPGFFKRFDIQEYTKGGKYFDVASGEDVTGRVYSSGSIDVSTGKPSLRASDTQVEAPTSGRKIRTNLFKQSAGWKWVGEAPAKTSTLVSVEMGKDHLYTLNSQFDTPVEMARYEDKKSEPRLRPTTRGVLRVGEKVGEIEVRGRVHPVYDKITTATDAPGRGVVNRGEDSLQFRPEGNDNTTAIAADYVRKAFGREYSPHTVYDEAPEARLKEIADYFQNVAKHQPDAPEVLRSYRAMADETVEQYKAMIAAGIKPEPYGGKGEPYASSEEMMRDVRENKHLYFLRTDNAFGQGTQDAANPLLEKSGQRIGDFELLVNDVFRVVHDYFGHTQQGLQFGPRGEFNAWKSHSRMYSDEAQGAVAAETLAQNAWVNFGAHLRRADGSIPKKGEEGYVPPQERPFGEQKNFLVPQELMQFRPESGQTETPEFKKWFGDSQVVDEDGNPVAMYHGAAFRVMLDEDGRLTDTPDFTAFKPNERGLIFVSPDPEFASKFSERYAGVGGGYGDGARVYKLFVKAENPFDFENPEHVRKLFGNADRLSTPNLSVGFASRGEVMDGSYSAIEALSNQIKNSGFDGLYVEENGVKNLAVFDPTQLKSATGNRGTFDPENPDIQYRPEEKSRPIGEVGEQKFTVTSKKGGAVTMTVAERYADQMVHAEALPLEFSVNSKGVVKTDDKGPKVATREYNFYESPVVAALNIDPEVLQSLKTKLNTTTLGKVKAGYVQSALTADEQAALTSMVNAYSDRAIADFRRYAADPDVKAAAGWYSDIAEFFKQLIPDQNDRTKFLEFLGGTSPNTSVEQNFLYALDLFNRWKKGELDGLLNNYRRVLNEFDANVGEYAELKPVLLKSGKQAIKDGQPLSEWVFKPGAEEQFRKDYFDAMVADGVPRAEARRESRAAFNEEMFWVLFNLRNGVKLERAGEGGGKYGVHTDRILQILDGVWREQTDAPKAPNFTENLAGLSTRATIDVWAARWLRRLGHDGLSAVWRILPMAEQGVSNSDFFLGQEIFAETTKRINEQFADTLGRTIGADDLQAIMWFAEKREWRRRGWANIEDLGDFRQYAYALKPQADGTFVLNGVTLNSTSINFLKTLSGVVVEGATLKSRDTAMLKQMREARDAQISQAMKEENLSPTAMAAAERKYLAAQAVRGQKVSTKDYREQP